MDHQDFRAERAPWGSFPKVLRNGDLGSLSKEPEYLAAKGGDRRAALELVDRLVSDELISTLDAALAGAKPRIVPVLASEASGHNKIPLAFAEVLADRLGLWVETGILQREKVSRTDSGADHRLAFNPTFTGSVVAGQDYLLVDDTLTMGGTLASLRGYIENRGGHVVAASVMTAHPGAVELAVKPKMLAAIDAKHGSAMNEFWQETFGYGIDKLTQGEAGHLKAAASVDAIRARIARARYAGIEHLDAGGIERSTQSPPVAAGQVAASGAEVEAQALEQQQRADIERVYETLLYGQVEAKQLQVGRIEARLGELIARQQKTIRSHQERKPGFLSLPSAKNSWASQETAQQVRLSSLMQRVESVRKIREGMGLHAPKLEELAARKLRQEQPDIARAYDADQESKRRRSLSERGSESDRALKQDRRSGRVISQTQKPGR